MWKSFIGKIMRFTLEELKKATNAEIKGYVDGDFEISTDTRTIKKGDIYLPLKGENFDGNSLYVQAFENRKRSYECA